MISAEERGAI
jgi:hypothetical protein